MSDETCDVCGSPMLDAKEMEGGEDVDDGVRTWTTLRVGKLCSNVNCPTNRPEMAPPSEHQS